MFGPLIYLIFFNFSLDNPQNVQQGREILLNIILNIMIIITNK